ncbi:bifunctional ornithine acetyltransferase/N-acetylglutamate synthase [Ammoniphilus resinae]|uniref:Arginine biosynthesis bifunctional protein ArgJ n=1 Tax=Ammoniphilus resinae TaxID=861532 RepID=A0ABS4GNJ1_9BACL|nr:bifunctional ornithine acetyltransferase/N-acetylglutamate synthase [Ammoniphilus resinae]MBP1931627.1 glutamate N-acetyltransferase/amino-acid N-acetyltransferase [Ammoniphilus resinae]
MCAYQVIEGHIAKPQGYQATGIYSGIKKVEKLDLGLILSEVPAASAAVYTTNLFQAPPCHVTRESLEKEGKLQAVVVNSGNANACTGSKGVDDAKMMQHLVSQSFGVPKDYVAVASTGVIGQFLPMDCIEEGILQLPKALNNESAPLFSQSIMTTDLIEKTVCVELPIDGKKVTIAGTAKGSGMIEPNMATMLGFITTDVKIEQSYLQKLLRKATDTTFNMITVDGDTSTNDMVVLMANGMAENNELNEQHPEEKEFYQALLYVMQELAKKIARDGEGATKLIEVEVTGAPSVEAARQVAKSVIGSSLVKTAVFGADANWGRILCAVGYSSAPIQADKLDVFLGSIQVVEASFPIPFSEEEAYAYLQGDTVKIGIHLNEGEYQAIAWGCDLTYDYVKINAHYRT